VDQDNRRDRELKEEFAAARDPESPAVLKERIDQLEERIVSIEHATHTNV
jgi:hypothetical protein